MKGARTVIRIPSEVITGDFFHDTASLTLSRATPEYAATSKQIAPASMKGESSDGIESRMLTATPYIRRLPKAAKAMSTTAATNARLRIEQTS